MTEKIALKLLKHSDITLFRPYYETHKLDQKQSKQKAINLNADVFIDVFYPTIRSGSPDRYRVDLRIFGPGLSGEYPLQRKVIRQQKNWRLDGELVDNPIDEPTRFNSIAPGDLAIISFDGVLPDLIALYLLSASNEYDKQLVKALSRYVSHSPRTMVEIELSLLQRIIQETNPDEQHPLRDLFLEDVLEDAAQDGIEGVQKLKRQVSRRRITAEVLKQARENASRTGRTGEEIINSYLIQLKERGEIDDFTWVSDDNAISPHDFKVQKSDNTIFVEVKSTAGEFGNTLHISFNELLQMREPLRYDLYRVYEITETGAQLRIKPDMRQFAENILLILEQLPQGVRPDSISVDPEILNFEPATNLEFKSTE